MFLGMYLDPNEPKEKYARFAAVVAEGASDTEPPRLDDATASSRKDLIVREDKPLHFGAASPAARRKVKRLYVGTVYSAPYDTATGGMAFDFRHVRLWPDESKRGEWELLHDASVAAATPPPSAVDSMTIAEVRALYAKSISYSRRSSILSEVVARVTREGK